MDTHAIFCRLKRFGCLVHELNVLEIDLRPRDEDAVGTGFKIVCGWQRDVHVNFAVDGDLDFAVGWS